MGEVMILKLLAGVLALICLSTNMVPVKAEDPYRFFTWTVTYGTIKPLGVPQQGILINGKFPGPRIEAVTNDNIIINVINKLDQPFLITWNGIKNRKTPWQDGVLGTNCPILPNTNFTYKMQVKDQIGTFTYFPSTVLHKASGGFGGFNIYSRPHIPVPYDPPAADWTVLIGDWYTAGHKALEQTLDAGKPLGLPNGILINGKQNGPKFVGEPGKTYLLRISNVGLSTSINFRIQNHKMRLVEIEGTHVVQEYYDSLDIHVGQSVAVLIICNQAPKDYYIVASSRFTIPVLKTTARLRYANTKIKASGALPIGPTTHVHWSLKQARSFRWDLTASAARPNPQGTYHYGNIKTVRTLVLENSEALIDGKVRYAINGISYVNPETPLKLADWFNISGVFELDSIPDMPTPGPVKMGTPVIGTLLHDYVEIIFQNSEGTIQSWHLDGTDFWVVGFGPKKWEPDYRKFYNLVDATTRYTVQVYPYSWSMWNLRSADWARRYLGQELYVRVWNDEKSLYTESDPPPNAILCGKAVGVQLS
ncbi:hypothetical protein MKW94_017766 [Papaver nudicaule]|uniref:L-ascorbate oxidase n=1 Tax=Papaver nudicaule TaxID=74823 RepID=A0AA41SDQ1_PAPNU|nr:hypothetical protein [Papaver nudicaule]